MIESADDMIKIIHELEATRKAEQKITSKIENELNSNKQCKSKLHDNKKIITSQVKDEKHLIQRERDNIKIDKLNQLNDIKQSKIGQKYTDEQKQQISQIKYESSEHRQQLQVDLERTFCLHI